MKVATILWWCLKCDHDHVSTYHIHRQLHNLGSVTHVIVMITFFWRGETWARKIITFLWNNMRVCFLKLKFVAWSVCLKRNRCVIAFLDKNIYHRGRFGLIVRFHCTFWPVTVSTIYFISFVMTHTRFETVLSWMRRLFIALSASKLVVILRMILLNRFCHER